MANWVCSDFIFTITVYPIPLCNFSASTYHCFYQLRIHWSSHFLVRFPKVKTCVCFKRKYGHICVFELMWMCLALLCVNYSNYISLLKLDSYLVSECLLFHKMRVLLVCQKSIIQRIVSIGFGQEKEKRKVKNISISSRIFFSLDHYIQPQVDFSPQPA